ncbi:uncharacterized protein LOC129598993 [Paramacrobiotus metropolitanus]|uniref:uncharacterized protein LOC129598993 n=1 Tax=Paramacrobiotus metropolitanus TaxID=2943436 RepID=UPI002445EC57|nr:uncharacterized protein LOC129598993 [Paramacrobiotus metropolitanus]
MDLGKRRRISLASLQRISREHAANLDDRCDSVDVWSDDGQLQYGRIVDAAVGGLFIDFLCPDRRRQFVPFGRLFRMQHSWDLREHWGPPQLEVLWRAHPRGPWTWLGAELVVTVKEGYRRMDAALVRLYDAAGRATGPLQVVPAARIRYPGCDAVGDSGSSVLAGAHGRPPGEEELRRYYGEDYAELLVGPETFVFSRLQLPAKCAAAAEETQRCLMERCLYRPNRRWPPLEFLRRLDEGGTWLYMERTDGNNSWMGFREAALRLPLALPRMLRMLEVPAAVEATAGEGLQQLPVVLLSAVFSHLDAMEWTRLRPVCALFDAVLQSAPLAADLVVNGRDDYALLASLLHAFRSSVHRVVLRNGDLDSLLKVGDLAKHCPGMRERVPTIFLPRLTCRLSVDACPHKTRSGMGCAVGDLAEALRRLPGKEVVLLQCRVDLLDVDSCEYEEQRLQCRMDTPVNIPVARVEPTSTGLLRQVWDLLEAGLAWTAATDDQQRAADWLAEMRANQQPLGERQRQLLDTLGKTVCALEHALRRNAGPPLYAQCGMALQGVEVERAAPLLLACLVQGAQQWELRCDGALEGIVTQEAEEDYMAPLKALVETRTSRW